MNLQKAVQVNQMIYNRMPIDINDIFIYAYDVKIHLIVIADNKLIKNCRDYIHIVVPSSKCRISRASKYIRSLI